MLYIILRILRKEKLRNFVHLKGGIKILNFSLTLKFREVISGVGNYLNFSPVTHVHENVFPSCLGKM